MDIYRVTRIKTQIAKYIKTIIIVNPAPKASKFE